MTMPSNPYDWYGGYWNNPYPTKTPNFSFPGQQQSGDPTSSQSYSAPEVSGDVTFENVRAVMQTNHPDWPPEVIDHTAHIVTRYMLNSGVTMKQYAAEPWTYETGAEAEYGDYNQYQSYSGGWGSSLSDLQVQMALGQFEIPSTGDPYVDRMTLQRYNQAMGGQLETRWNKLYGGGGGEPELPPPPTFTTTCGNGTCVQVGSDGSVNTYPDPNFKPGYTSECANGTCTQFDHNGAFVGTYPDPGYVEPTYGEVKYDPNGQAYQIAPDGSLHYTGGSAPIGQPTSAPAGSAGWGQNWQEGPLRYDTASETMVRDWTRTPMSQQDALAQMQMANLPQNWYNTALQERTMSKDQRVFNNQVGALTGKMVSARQGYGNEFDLRQGQTAMDITPQGWAGVNNWQAGYDPSRYNPQFGTNNPFGGGQTGGYYTHTPSAQQMASWSPDQWGEMGGWYGSGLSGYSGMDQAMWEADRLRPPSGGGTRVYYR